MDIAFEEQGGVGIVKIGGRLDAVGAPEIELCCKERIENGTKRMVIDMGNVDYISSAGLRSLLVLAKSMKVAKGSLVVCALNPMVKEVMEISGFDKIFTIAADQAAAIAAV
jgi:anti-anti-sigma factor